VSVAALLRHETRTPIRVADQAEYDHTLQSIRAHLGDQRFDALVDQAATLPLEHVIGAAEAYGAFNVGG
jgi:hypothetical protein